GALFVRQSEDEDDAECDRLMLGGTKGAGRLFLPGTDPILLGRTEIAPKDWHHLVLVREGDRFEVFLDGRPEREISGAWTRPLPPPGPTQFRFGAGLEGDPGFEGKLAEIAVYDRSLTTGEIAGHFRAGSGLAGR